ncbi:MAG: hypothetical protein QXE81_06150 [Desulfurococcaceae archaeon]
MKLTGITQLDELVNPLYKHWIVEIYGEPRPVLSLLHYVMAYRSSVEKVHVLFNIEFGGVNTSYLVKLCRVLNCRLENILVSRAFRQGDTIKSLDELSSISDSLILLVYPYSYVSKDPSRYYEATRITGLISRISISNQVIVFNTITRHGKYMPEGGSFHHHIVKVIVRLVEQGRSIIADLVKHPAKNRVLRTIPLSLLEYPVKKSFQATIVDWVVRKEL